MSSTVEAPSQALAPRAASCVLTKPSTASAGTYQCLVVSQRADRREMLARAAAEVGWITVACADARNGLAASKREVFRLAVIDLAGLDSASVDSWRELSGQLAGTSDLLLMVCGNEGDALEEIWARQLGAWLYLPGVNDQCDVQTLCKEALPVGSRASKAKRSEVQQAG